MPVRKFRSDLRRYILDADKKVRQEILTSLLELGNQEYTYYRQVVADWSGKPRFDVVVAIKDNVITLTVTPTGEHAQKFLWVSEGTDGPYIIRPKKPGGKLKFRAGYSPRTQPGAQYGRGDGKATGSWATKDQVIHPGIEAREFVQEAARRIRPGFERSINNAIRRGINRARG